MVSSVETYLCGRPHDPTEVMCMQILEVGDTIRAYIELNACVPCISIIIGKCCVFSSFAVTFILLAKLILHEPSLTIKVLRRIPV